MEMATPTTDAPRVSNLSIPATPAASAITMVERSVVVSVPSPELDGESPNSPAAASARPATAIRVA